MTAVVERRESISGEMSLNLRREGDLVPKQKVWTEIHGQWIHSNSRKSRAHGPDAGRCGCRGRRLMKHASD